MTSDEQGTMTRAVRGLALRASLPGGDAHATASALAALREVGEALAADEAISVRLLLWQATHDPTHLVEAKRRLDFLVEHAPPGCGESMLTNVRVHRELAAAAKEHGL